MKADFNNFVVANVINSSVFEYHHDKYLYNICVTQTDSEQDSISYENTDWVSSHKLICTYVLYILSLYINQNMIVVSEQWCMIFILNDNHDAYADNMQHQMLLL